MLGYNALFWCWSILYCRSSHRRRYTHNRICRCYPHIRPQSARPLRSNVKSLSTADKQDEALCRRMEHKPNFERLTYSVPMRQHTVITSLIFASCTLQHTQQGPEVGPTAGKRKYRRSLLQLRYPPKSVRSPPMVDRELHPCPRLGKRCSFTGTCGSRSHCNRSDSRPCAG